MRRILAKLRSEGGQDTFEYLLVVGVIVVPMALAMILGFALLVPEILGETCSSVDTAPDGLAGDSCLGALPENTPTPAPP